jgi:hypothetical protein
MYVVSFIISGLKCFAFFLATLFFFPSFPFWIRCLLSLHSVDDVWHSVCFDCCVLCLCYRQFLCRNMSILFVNLFICFSDPYQSWKPIFGFNVCIYIYYNVYIYIHITCNWGACCMIVYVYMYTPYIHKNYDTCFKLEHFNASWSDFTFWFENQTYEFNICWCLFPKKPYKRMCMYIYTYIIKIHIL